MINPISFRPGPVTFWTTITYLALLVPLVVINERVPQAPVQQSGVALAEAWLDLANLTKAYHPYNSRANSEVRDWLLLRTQQILDSNGASWSTDKLRGDQIASKDSDVVVFDDNVANITFLFSRALGNLVDPTGGMQAAYFEGTNLYVYIKGTEDDGISWTADGRPGPKAKYDGTGLTLVNAHYDSVSTGYGATDDGMGVVSVLQLIRYFTTPGNRPKRGIVALFNNGEEDFLYGARAFGQSPLLPYIHTFLNLEGAGAGGRAMLFRTTDQEVTAAYAGTKDPFGSVIASDAFGLGFVRSQTDFIVLNGIFGQRGLDLAFYKPRDRYHTSQDDLVHTSRDSLWHMLSTSIHTMEKLSGDMADTFVGARPDGARNKVDNGNPSDGVWFDLFGKGFVLFNLRGMFAWSLTVLIATPLILMLVTYLLHKNDKYYFFTSKVRTYDQPDYEPVTVGGWKGFFRFPFALLVAVALSLGTAFLVRKVNPLIVNRNSYSVWAMLFSIFYFSLWAIMRGANFARPSALHRGYVHIWLFILGWASLVAVTVYEDRFRISAGYIFVFLQSAVFLSTLITLLELFALPQKTTWGQQVREDHEARDQLHNGDHHSSHLIAPTPGEVPTSPARDDESDSGDALPDESTPLVGGGASHENPRTTFATTYRRSISAMVQATRQRPGGKSNGPFDDEQEWSARLPTWAWLFQFLLLGPIVIILSTQAGLTLVDAVRQTGYDGSNTLLPFLIVVLVVVLILLPLSPFIHRVTYHVPVFLLVVFAGTLMYNLAAFPYSADARLVIQFQQTVDLNTGDTRTNFYGLGKYVRSIVAEMPSSAAQNVTCEQVNKTPTSVCSFDSSYIKPNLGAGFKNLVSVNATHLSGNKATLHIDAVDTKACVVQLGRRITAVAVHGSAGWDNRFGIWPESGVASVRLWRRDTSVPWVVDLEWTEPSGTTATGSSIEGQVVCMWSDANTPGTIPALDEAIKFAPTWVAISKRAEGLVEGTKTFKIAA